MVTVSEFSIEDVLYFFSSEERKLFVSRLTKMKLKRGENLFAMDDNSEELFFIIEGELAVKKHTGFEDKMQVVALLGAGAVVGEGNFFRGKRRTATLTATMDSEIYSISREKYADLKKSNPETALALCEYCVSVSGMRLNGCTGRLAHIL